MLGTYLRAAAVALVVGVAVAALVACGDAPSGDIPTGAGSLFSENGTATSSDLTSSDDGGGTVTAPGDRPQGPPEEALAACAEQPAEAECSFASPVDGSTIDGTCRARRDDASQQVCRPDDWDGRGGPGHGRQGPPEEALAACQGLEIGAACSFEAPFGAAEGTCSEGQGDSGQVACRPEWAEGQGPFGPGGGNGHGLAMAACEGLQAEAACSFEAPIGTVSGACRTGRDGNTLICVPPDGLPH